MDIRNIQKTGNMFYVYLPTSWCRKHSITSKSQVSVNMNNDSTLVIHPQITKKQRKNIILDLDETDKEIINKLIVACYLNPTASFKINLKKELTATDLLDQKKLISVEVVEFDGKHITCESSISVEDPFSLLITMMRKIHNLLVVMRKNYNTELVARYEDEIDRSKMLIEKSALSGLSGTEASHHKPVDLHYIVLVARDLENVVDQLCALGSKEKKFFANFHHITESLKTLFESSVTSKNNISIDYAKVIVFFKLVQKIKEKNITTPKMFIQARIKTLLVSISEHLFDWSVANSLNSD